MIHRVIECLEFDNVEISVSDLLRNDTILNPEISERGYLNVRLRKGKVVLTCDRHVGLIPLSESTSISIRPRFPLRNLAEMIALSGVRTNVIENFGRGHAPSFVEIGVPPLALATSLVSGAEAIAHSGLRKEYINIASPQPFRGRLQISSTVRQHRAKGKNYSASFEQTELSAATWANIAIKAALSELLTVGVRANPARARQVLDRAKVTKNFFASVPDYQGRKSDLVFELLRELPRISDHVSSYRKPMWAALMLLQSRIPSLERKGFVPLDSLIVDMADLFETFVRTQLQMNLKSFGYRVVDGNREPGKLFVGPSSTPVTPDIIVIKDGSPAAVFDTKYKPSLKANDRYQVISYMEAYGVSKGGLILPLVTTKMSRLLGTTIGGKELSELRLDLSDDIMVAGREVANDVRAIIEG